MLAWLDIISIYIQNTEKARRALFFAFREALSLGATEIRATHLLLGLLREGKTLFASWRLSKRKLKTMHEACQGHTSTSPHAKSQFMDFDQESRAVLLRAAQEMQNRRNKNLDIEHLLLALLYVPGKAKDILNYQGLAYGQVSAVVPFQPADDASAGNALDYT